VLSTRPQLRKHAGGRVVLGLRPEDIEEGAGPPGRRLTVTVDIREDMGAEIFLHFAIQAPPVQTTALKEMAGEEAAEAAEIQGSERGATWVARVARGAVTREGDQAQLTVDTGLLHFFDLENGVAIGDSREADR
jgi:multiple sugar transport system ATP-binding protein